MADPAAAALPGGTGPIYGPANPPPNLPPLQSNVNSIAFSPLHKADTSVTAELADHNVTNITAEVDDGLKEFGSLDELRKKNLDNQKGESWISRNWSRLLMAAIAIAFLVIPIIVFPPWALVGASGLAIAFKLMGLGFGLFLGATLGIAAITKQQPTQDPRVVDQMLYLNKNAEAYNKNVNERLNHYHRDPALPPNTPEKIPAEWTDWKMDVRVFEVMHSDQLAKLKKRYEELVDGQEKQDKLKEINRLREQLDAQEQNFAKEMGMVPKDAHGGRYYRTEHLRDPSAPPYKPTNPPRP